MNRLVGLIAQALASGLFLSYLPAKLFKTRIGTGAGLVGTAWGVVALPLIATTPLRQALIWVGCLAVSIGVGHVAEKAFATKDDPRIVIDETIGFLTAMLFLPHSALAIGLAFVLFRLFDVWKPGVIRRSSKLPGGWGVVLDDVIAGAFANIILQWVNVMHPL